MKLMPYKSNGFTLLEVLIAAFILFIVLSGATLVYSSSIKSRMSAESALVIHGVSPLLQEHVNIQVRNGTFSGEDQFWGVNYVWIAKITQQKSLVGNSEQNVSDNQRVAVLLNVNMELVYKRRREILRFDVVRWD